MPQTVSWVDFISLENILLFTKWKLEEIEDSVYWMKQITGEGDGLGSHCEDAVYNGYTARELCRKLKLKVQPKPRPARKAKP
jgi:hypothetical protein